MTHKAITLLTLLMAVFTTNAYDYDNWPRMPIDSLYSVTTKPFLCSVSYHNDGKVTRNMIYDNEGKPLIEIWNTKESFRPDTILYSSDGKAIAYFSNGKSGRLKNRLPKFATKHSIERDEIYVNTSNVDDHGNWQEAHAKHFARILRIFDYNLNDNHLNLIETYSQRRADYEDSDRSLSMGNECFLGLFPGVKSKYALLSIATGILAFIFIRRMRSNYNYAIASVTSAGIMAAGIIPYYRSLFGELLLNSNFISWSALFLGAGACVFTYFLISKMSVDKKYSNDNIEFVGNVWCMFATAVAFFPLLNAWMWTWLAVCMSLLTYGIMLMVTMLSHIHSRCPKCHSKGALYIADIIDDGKVIREKSYSFHSHNSGPHDIDHSLWWKTYKTTRTESDIETTEVYQNLLCRYECIECDYKKEERMKGDLLSRARNVYSKKKTTKHIEPN